MAIQGFNYQEFAQNLTLQAKDLVPQDFSDVEKQYVVNTLLNFSNLAGEAIYNDTESNFNADQAMMITQIIAEWSFHKSVDLIRSKIPREFWDPVMQKIAFTIFEIAKQTFKQGLPQDQILQLIEHHVKKTYNDAIGELKDKGLISQELMDIATSQSNIDAMTQQATDEQIAQEQVNTNAPQNSQVPANSQTSQESVATPKVMKLATVALVFQRMKQEKVQSYLDKFSPDDAQTVIKYMGMRDLNTHVSVPTAIKCLNEIKTNLPHSQEFSPSKIIKKLQNITKNIDRQQLETILNPERLNVKRFVFNALDDEYYEIPPKIANIIASHVQDSV